MNNYDYFLQPLCYSKCSCRTRSIGLTTWELYGNAEFWGLPQTPPELESAF